MPKVLAVLCSCVVSVRVAAVQFQEHIKIFVIYNLCANINENRSY